MDSKNGSYLLAFLYPSIISHSCQASCGAKDPKSQEPFNTDGGRGRHAPVVEKGTK